jgi:hypothetical protein
MVIPLTLEALILREKKNKRKTKTMINNIKNTMCRLADLTQEQIDSLQKEMPYGQFDFRHNEPYIGVTKAGGWGTWAGAQYPAIVTYTEMMQLLGKDMNKQTAQEQIAVMQIEMDKLKAIINKQEAKPEAKTGRVMLTGELSHNDKYYICTGDVADLSFSHDKLDRKFIEAGIAFHDKETAERHLQCLKLEQELRRAQIADGGVRGEYCLILLNDGSFYQMDMSHYWEKISFNTHSARKAFRAAHTDEQLTLLIRGV